MDEIKEMAPVSHIRNTYNSMIRAIKNTLNINGSVKKIFGTWAWKAVDTIHHAQTDGIVCARAYVTEDNKWLTAYGTTDPNANPAIIRSSLSATRTSDTESRPGSFAMPVRKGDYWKVYKYNNTGTYVLACFWLPIGE